MISLHERARIDGGIALAGTESHVPEAYFHVLWAASFPRLKNWNHAHVFDPFWRVYWNGKPGNQILFEERKIPLQPGQFVLVPAHVLFQTSSSPEPVPHLCLHFTISPHLFLPASKPSRLPADPATKAIARDLEIALAKATPNVSYCHQRCLSLLHGLFAKVFSDRPPLSSDRQEIVRILQTIEANPAVFLHPDEMARAVNMSGRNFHRHFLGTVGKSPGAYLKEVRLREAARRLAGTDQSIEAIAEDLGFADRFHFSRLFRTFTGQPPAAFRKNRGSK